jgi:hypothetical protein
MEEHRLVVVHIDILIDDDDHLGPGHLPRAPDGVHDAAGLEGGKGAA